MKTGETTNEYCTPVSTHVCDTCGEEYTVCPAIPDDKEGWESCLAWGCVSYEPDRDVDVLFMSDAEIAEREIVSMDMLRKRKQGTKMPGGTYAANLEILKGT